MWYVMNLQEEKSDMERKMNALVVSEMIWIEIDRKSVCVHV